jgi:hypothetical protein
MLEDDLPAAKEALEGGADPNTGLGELLDRYKDVNLD